MSTKTNPLELSKDESFGIRYANFTSIINAIDSYLSTHPDKDKILHTSIQVFISINDILKQEQPQLLLLSELLIFICSISINKDTYIETVSELDTSLCELYFNIVEKYLLIDPDRLSRSKSQILDKSVVISNYVKKHDKEKSNLLSIIKDYEHKITQLSSAVSRLEKTKTDLELKLSDKEREIAMMKQNNMTTNKIRDELISSTLIHSELTSQIQEKNLQIESLQKEIEIINEHNKDIVSKLTEEKEILQQKAYEYNNIKAQYDKLHLKYKELQEQSKHISSITKQQMESANELSAKQTTINYLQKEKEGLLKQIEKLNKDILIEKETTNAVMLDKKKLEFEYEDLKTEYKRQEELYQQQQHSTKRTKMEESDLGITLGNFLDMSKDMQLRQGSKDNFEFNNVGGASNQIVFNPHEEAYNRLKEENITIIGENQFLKEKNQNLSLQKQHLDIKLEKADVDKQKLTLTIDRLTNTINNLENENKCLDMKLKDLNTSKKNEIDLLKNEIKSKTKLIETMLAEKKNAVNDFHKLQKEFDIIKQNQSATNEEQQVHVKKNTFPYNKPSLEQNVVSNSEVLRLQNDIQNLKLQSLQKDEEIRKLKESIDEFNNSNTMPTNNGNKSNDHVGGMSDDEINTKLADLDFYKKSYEEQKARVNKEHELISDSLYKLAVHFMSLKDNLNRKNKNK